MPEIARQFRVLANEVAGSSDAVIQSAFPIGQAELSELIATLEKRFGRKLEAKVQVTPELIGGGKLPMVANMIQQNMLKIDNKPLGSAIAVSAMLVVAAIALVFLFLNRRFLKVQK